ncbi:energy-coupling factor transporter ATPase [Bacillus sp. FJAT-49711]|uniref:energy-coupling factor transporter ATPase n=1 Tax=Bacillus sp. FJAT-49711 TaxID=2833585 RepID=UPI001BC98F77|nr:energy-coupling factor transporter ATPase [Bacillus sp. FJAT-49711]MBS4217421.1 energy-coupling factor transporter ATPase [Bacillus sp. FJAT-49711]
MSEPILEVENITFRYDMRQETEILNNVTFSVNRGEWVAIIGHNGSGKSTLAKILVGLLTPEKGRIHIAGIEMKEFSKWDARRRIGLVFQNPENQFIGTSVQDDVAFALENMNLSYEEMKKRVEDALEAVDMSSFRLHDPSHLSGGQKQRVAIAGILALRPDVLLLDEALVMLDPRSRRELISILRHLKTNEDISIVSITHDMNEAAAADRIIVMKEGRVVCNGSPKEVFSNNHIEVEMPITEQLRQKLINRGRKVPDHYMTEEEMVKFLWK